MRKPSHRPMALTLALLNLAGCAEELVGPDLTAVAKARLNIVRNAFNVVSAQLDDGEACTVGSVENDGRDVAVTCGNVDADAAAVGDDGFDFGFARNGNPVVRAKGFIETEYPLAVDMTLETERELIDCAGDAIGVDTALNEDAWGVNCTRTDSSGNETRGHLRMDGDMQDFMRSTEGDVDKLKKAVRDRHGPHARNASHSARFRRYAFPPWYAEYSLRRFA